VTPPPTAALRRAAHFAIPVLLLGFAACRSPIAKATAPDAIGVGAIPTAPGYTSIVEGMTLALERLREEGGPSLRLRTPAATAGSSTASAVQIAMQLRDDPSVLAVVGHPESGNTLEAVPVYADAEHDGASGVPVISPTATSPRLTGISPWFFRVAPSDADAARITADWVRDSLHAVRAAIVYRNDSYGRDWAETFARTFASGAGAAGTIIAREPYLTGVVEWDAYAALLARLRPDVVLFPGDADDAIALLSALRELQVRLPFIGGDGTEGMQRDPVAAGAHYVTFFDAARATGAEAERFIARYRARYKHDPDYFAAQAYDAALVIGRTVARGARTRAALRRALEDVGTATPAVDGVGGPIAFASTHDVRGRGVVVTRIAEPTPAARGPR